MIWHLFFQIWITDAAAYQAHAPADGVCKTGITQRPDLIEYVLYYFFCLFLLLQTWLPRQVSEASQQLAARRDYRRQ